MGTINWNELANKAASLTDAEFAKQIAGLVKVDTSVIDSFIKESSITHKDALQVLKVLHDATKTNNEKVAVVSKIEKGVGFLLQIATKAIV